MSGGSGARVNASTLRCIQLLRRRVTQEQERHMHHDHDHDHDHGRLSDDSAPGDCLPFELVWDPPEPAAPADSAGSAGSADTVSALDAVAPAQDYAKMRTGAVVNTVLFSAKSPLLHTQYNQECCDLLQGAFLTPAHGLVGDLPLLVQTVAASCNFQVAEVTRVENKPLWDMHRQYAESYAVTNSKRVYHGTAHAHSIARVGFRGAASNRAKFGRGIYTSAGVFQALAYAQLTPEDTLTFVVAELHLGPVGLGTENQVRFTPCTLCAPALKRC